MLRFDGTKVETNGKTRDELQKENYITQISMRIPQELNDILMGLSKGRGQERSNIIIHLLKLGIREYDRLLEEDAKEKNRHYVPIKQICAKYNEFRSDARRKEIEKNVKIRKTTTINKFLALTKEESSETEQKQ